MSNYILKEAVEYGHKTIGNVELPEKIKTKHLKGLNINFNKTDDVINFISNCIKMPISFVEELTFEDFTNLSEKLMSKLGEHPSQEIGKK